MTPDEQIAALTVEKLLYLIDDYADAFVQKQDWGRPTTKEAKAVKAALTELVGENEELRLAVVKYAIRKDPEFNWCAECLAYRAKSGSIKHADNCSVRKWDR